MKTNRLLPALILVSCALAARVFAADAPAYGAPISLPAAKQVLAAAQAEATKNNWNVAIAIVDSGGHLVAFERMDTTQYGSVVVAQVDDRYGEGTAVKLGRALEGGRGLGFNVTAGAEGGGPVDAAFKAAGIGIAVRPMDFVELIKAGLK